MARLTARAAVSLPSFIVAIMVTPALAHHSFARFDADRQVTLEGIVQEFMWTNPHAWIILEVDRKGHDLPYFFGPRLV